MLNTTYHYTRSQRSSVKLISSAQLSSAAQRTPILPIRTRHRQQAYNTAQGNQLCTSTSWQHEFASCIKSWAFSSCPLHICCILPCASVAVGVSRPRNGALVSNTVCTSYRYLILCKKWRFKFKKKNVRLGLGQETRLNLGIKIGNTRTAARKETGAIDPHIKSESVASGACQQNREIHNNILPAVYSCTAVHQLEHTWYH